MDKNGWDLYLYSSLSVYPDHSVFNDSFVCLWRFLNNDVWVWKGLLVAWRLTVMQYNA